MVEKNSNDEALLRGNIYTCDHVGGSECYENYLTIEVTCIQRNVDLVGHMSTATQTNN